MRCCRTAREGTGKAGPEAAFTPHQVGKVLTRSAGAVANALDKLTPPAPCRWSGGNLTERASGVRWQVVGQADDPVAAGGYLGVVGGQDDRAAAGRDGEHAD